MVRRFRVLALLAVLSGLFVGLSLTPATSRAASTVTVGIDQPCTAAGLEQAIADASPGGTVTFDCDPASITFSNHIEIHQDVIIDGSNAGNDTRITLSGNSTTYLFAITAGKLTLRHITLANSNDSTGAIQIESSGAAEITGSVFSFNVSWILGGAIHNKGTVVISHSTFAFNSANNGGAIYNSGNATISNSTFIFNSTPFLGGAIRNDGSATISQSNFTLNDAGNDGGAIDSTGSLSVQRSTSANNRASLRGGAISAWQGSLNLVASTLWDNTATTASAINVSQYIQNATIAWSTIVQAPQTASALSISQQLTLEGVILGGSGEHCRFDGGSLSDSYSLSNDTSCNLTGVGSQQNIPNLGLGVLATTIIEGVEHAYYPLVDGSPAVDAGPTSCDTALIEGPDPDQLGNPRPYHHYCDIGAIESTFATTLLCANTWNGTLRVSDTIPCNRSESSINIAQAAPVPLCVNTWNNATRTSATCARSERQVVITGDRTTPACVDKWSGTLRIAPTCTRSETSHWL